MNEERIQFTQEEIQRLSDNLRRVLLTDVILQAGTEEGAPHISDETFQEALCGLKELQEKRD